ncbi:MAG: molybdate ABC transporter substrate-binding protein [Sulfurospirillum sp.]
MARLLIVFLCFLSFSTLGVAGEYGRIFASSNLEFVFSDMIKSFYAKYPSSSVHIQYGSSGSLFEDIQDGNKYDIFFSADMRYPQMLYKNGKAVSPPKAYVRGFLVLIGFDDKVIKQNGLKCLRNSDIKKIMIANKTTAPYGKASIEILKNAGLYKNVKQKIEYSLDVALVIDGVLWNHYIGFIPKSALGILPKNKINWIDVDKRLYSPIIQGYAISKKGIKNKNAMNFLKFITSPGGGKIFKKYGYETISMK